MTSRSRSRVCAPSTDGLEQSSSSNTAKSDVELVKGVQSVQITPKPMRYKSSLSTHSQSVDKYKERTYQSKSYLKPEAEETDKPADTDCSPKTDDLKCERGPSKPAESRFRVRSQSVHSQLYLNYLKEKENRQQKNKSKSEKLEAPLNQPLNKSNSVQDNKRERTKPINSARSEPSTSRNERSKLPNPKTCENQESLRSLNAGMSLLNKQQTEIHDKLVKNTRDLTIKQTPSYIKQFNKPSLNTTKGHTLQVKQRELRFDELQPFQNPKLAIRDFDDKMNSNDWNENFECLQQLLRIICFHEEELAKHVVKICKFLTRCVRSLRNLLSRAACQVCAELFPLKLHIPEQCAENLVNMLLNATSNTSSNVLRQDAITALESMCAHFTLTKSLDIIFKYAAKHHNPIVRTTAARLLMGLAKRLGNEEVCFKLPPKMRGQLLTTCTSLLLEGRQDTRNFAKEIFKVLKGNHKFYFEMHELLPAATYRNVTKILQTIK